MNWILEKTRENGTVIYLVFSTDVWRFYIFFLFFYQVYKMKYFFILIIFSHLPVKTDSPMIFGSQV